MKLIIFLFALLCFAFAQSCCNNPQVCVNGSTCLCETGVDTCMFQMTDQDQAFTVDNTSINYFYWMPTVESYNNVEVFLCLNSNQYVSFNMGFYVQDSNGTGYPTDLNFTTQSKNTGCWMVSLGPQRFCQLPNQTYCDLMMGLQLLQEPQTSLKIFVNASIASNQFVIPLAISLGVLLVVFIIVLIVCIIKKRRERNQQLYKVQNDIAHFQQFFPQMTLKQILQLYPKQQQVHNCSVCLVDIQMTQMTRITPCCHIFHAQCIDLWCKKSIICPLCRQSLDIQNLKAIKALLQQDVSQGLKTNNPNQTIQEQINNTISTPHQNMEPLIQNGQL